MPVTRFFVCCLVLASLGACKQRAAQPDRRAQEYQAALDRCLASVGPSHLPFPRRALAAFDECAPLMGAGACGETWTSVPHTTREERGGRTRLSLVIEACRDQHCPTIDGERLRACSSGPGEWATDEEQAIWASLHAAILPRVFGEVEGAQFDRDAAYLAARLYPFVVPPVVSETVGASKEGASEAVDAPGLELFIDRDGLSIGVVGGRSYRLPRCGVEYDAAGLGSTTCELRKNGAASRHVTIAAADEISYEQIVAVMDDAIASGLDPSVTDVGSVEVDDSEPRPSPWSCGRQPTSCEAQPERAAGSNASGFLGPELLREAKILIIAPEQVHLETRTVVSVRELEQSRTLYDQRLVDALRAAKPPLEGVAAEDLELRRRLANTLILQADRRTSAKVLTVVLKSAYKAGYPEVMFAVNTRTREVKEASSTKERGWEVHAPAVDPFDAVVGDTRQYQVRSLSIDTDEPEAIEDALDRAMAEALILALDNLPTSGGLVLFYWDPVYASLTVTFSDPKRTTEGRDVLKVHFPALDVEVPDREKEKRWAETESLVKKGLKKALKERRSAFRQIGAEARFTTDSSGIRLRKL